MAYQLANGKLITSVFSELTARSFAIWVKLTAGDNPIFYKKLAVGEILVRVCKDGTGWRVEIKSNSGANTPGNVTYFENWYKIQDETLTPSTGFFVFITWDGANTWIAQKDPRVWVSGTEIPVSLAKSTLLINNATPPTNDPSQAWRIGDYNWGFGFDYLNGGFAEVALWEVVLSATQAAQVSLGNAANKYTTGLLCYYPLVNDAVDWVSQNAGTLTGATAIAHPTITQAVNPVRPAPPVAPNQADVISLYNIGNSKSDEINTYNVTGLPALVIQGGKVPVFGRHSRPGAPLSWLSPVDAGGSVDLAYGNSWNALGNFPWGFVSLEPFDLQIDADLVECLKLIDRTLSFAANAAKPTTFILYERGPRNVNANQQWIPAEFKARWERTYVSGLVNQPEECADYFEKLHAAIKQARPNIKLVIAPVGDAYNLFNTRAMAGSISGFTSAWDLYMRKNTKQEYDNIHSNGWGSYLTALTYYSILTGKTPVGITATDSFRLNDFTLSDALPSAALQTAIQGCVKDAITQKSAFTGITTFDPATVVSPPVVTPPTPTQPDNSDAGLLATITASFPELSATDRQLALTAAKAAATTRSKTGQEILAAWKATIGKFVKVP